MDTRLQLELERRLGSRVEQFQPLGGGCINHAFRVRLADRRALFVKAHPHPPAAMFLREAAGLRWLAETRALRVPRVVAACDASTTQEEGACSTSFLALEWIDQAPPGVEHDERLGRGIARLHRHDAPAFGHDHDNYIATLLQSNATHDSWPTFYVERRLRPQVAIATARGYLSPALRQRLERVMSLVDRLCGPPEPPARLHGDLWSGNVMHDETGAPVLIDPAVYAGHREMDLAMMQLFGGFGARCFAAYDEVYTREPGHQTRVALYQLYPLLVHLNLFGTCYVANLEGVLKRLP